MRMKNAKLSEGNIQLYKHVEINFPSGACRLLWIAATIQRTVPSHIDTSPDFDLSLQRVSCCSKTRSKTALLHDALY